MSCQLACDEHDVSRPPPPTRDRGSIIPLQLGELAARRRPAQQAAEDPLHPGVLPPAALRPNLRGQHQVRPHTSISTDGELRRSQHLVVHRYKYDDISPEIGALLFKNPH